MCTAHTDTDNGKHQRHGGNGTGWIDVGWAPGGYAIDRQTDRHVCAIAICVPAYVLAIYRGGCFMHTIGSHIHHTSASVCVLCVCVF
mmetsp:Transcript_34885/g.100402  ORF Transcript_34885/g.100402 Transcript_34885/m.100402 type:complete len:87 (+) Transcript_34885:1550-1810(+)